MWTEWKTKFLQIVDKHAPIRIKRVRSKNSPWITADLKERMHNRDTLKIKAIKSNDPHDWANFKKMRNKVNTACWGGGGGGGMPSSIDPVNSTGVYLTGDMHRKSLSFNLGE